MNLRYDYFAAYDAGIDLHAQEEMRRLGITYSRAEAQPIGEQWWFYDCENVPEPLPSYLSVLDGFEQPYSLATHTDPRVIWAELTELREIVGDLARIEPRCESQGSGILHFCHYCDASDNEDHGTVGASCLWLRSQKWRKP